MSSVRNIESFLILSAQCCEILRALLGVHEDVVTDILDFRLNSLASSLLWGHFVLCSKSWKGQSTVTLFQGYI